MLPLGGEIIYLAFKNLSEMKTDVLIIGNGLSALRAAISIIEDPKDISITILSVSKPFRGSSSFSSYTNGWGIQFPLTDCEKETLKQDILRACKGQCEEDLVNTLVEKSSEKVKELIAWGVKPKRSYGNSLYRFKGCFSSQPISVLFPNIFSISNVFKKILKHSRVNVIEHHLALDIIKCNNLWLTSALNLKTRNLVIIQSKVIILATGGGSSIFKYNLNYPYNTGHGYRIGASLGLHFTNMEFIQFIFCIINNRARYLLNQKLLNLVKEIKLPNGETLFSREFFKSNSDLMNLRAEHAPFSSSFNDSAIDIAIYKNSQKFGFLPLRMIISHPTKTDEVNLFLVDWLEKLREQVKTSQILFTHCAHAFNGGFMIETDTSPRPYQPGLFIIGELATGMHGADRVGGTMLLSCLVFGDIAGRSAVKYINTNAFEECHYKVEDFPFFQVLSQPTQITFKEILKLISHLQSENWASISIVRKAEKLREHLAFLNSLEKDLKNTGTNIQNLYDFYNLTSLLLTSKMITIAAFNRKECLGAHYIEP